MGSLTRAYSCKRPALVTTTFSNSRGGRLRELRLYIDCFISPSRKATLDALCDASNKVLIQGIS